MEDPSKRKERERASLFVKPEKPEPDGSTPGTDDMDHRWYGLPWDEPAGGSTSHFSRLSTDRALSLYPISLYVSCFLLPTLFHLSFFPYLFPVTTLFYRASRRKKEYLSKINIHGGSTRR